MTLIVRWCDTLANVREAADVEELTLSVPVKTMIGLATIALTCTYLGGKKRRFRIPRLAKECSAWVSAELEFN